MCWPQGAALPKKSPCPGVLSPALLWGFCLSPMPALAPLNIAVPFLQAAFPAPGLHREHLAPRGAAPGLRLPPLAQATGAMETEVSGGWGVREALQGRCHRPRRRRREQWSRERVKGQGSVWEPPGAAAAMRSWGQGQVDVG